MSNTYSKTLCAIFMVRISSLLFLFGLLACSRTNQRTEVKAGDTLASSVGVSDNGASQNDYTAASVYIDIDSDSLLLDNDDLEKLILLFRTKGTKTRSLEYGEGDCEGKHATFIFKQDTLMIDKYSCGDYGFGNSQFFTKGDSLIKVRRYKMEWSPMANANGFDVSEQIIDFHGDKLTLRQRGRRVAEWRHYDLSDIQFQTTNAQAQKDYKELRIELIELMSKDSVEP